VQIVREEVPALVFIQGFSHDILRSVSTSRQWVLQLGKYEPIAINHQNGVQSREYPPNVEPKLPHR
jgi:hypothetical protein